MKSDIQIAQEAELKPIREIAESLGIRSEEMEQYGEYKAKISLDIWERLKNEPDGKLILVTAVNPTPAGEGKSTTTVGLGQALARLGKKAMVTLREPSLGPCMGIKGGAAGGGYSQVVPMEDINLHFTGDIHAVSTAHNLLSAVIDNHIHQGNELGIDPRQVVWPRVLDMNDRALRNIVVGLGGITGGVPRQDSFMISVASEVMAILCLADSITDLKQRLSRIVVGYTYEGEPVTAGDLKVAGAMAMLLKDALKPNLVQTLENVPAFVHGGPFANIAHGCNSLIATRLGLKLADYLITEAGFGADLGAEKFFNIKCRYGGLRPDAAVIVVSVRALKLHGGQPRDKLTSKNLKALEEGFGNLQKHIENVTAFGVPVVVAVNRFPSDTHEELELVIQRCKEMGIRACVSEVWAKGGEGGIQLAEALLEVMDNQRSEFRFLYKDGDSIKDKIQTIVTSIYGGRGVEYAKQAEHTIKRLQNQGYGELPVCMAKTQYSLSDDPTLLGRPRDFTVTVRDVKISAGAGFIVVLTGDVMTMPGLPKVPAATKMDISKNGRIKGLF